MCECAMPAATSAATSTCRRPATSAVSRKLLPKLERPLHLTLRVTRRDVATLVAELLPLRERELDLDPPVSEVEAGVGGGEPLLAHLPIHPVDLLAVQQQLARPVGVVVRAVPLRVLRDV